MDPKWTSAKGCYLLNGKCMARGSAPRARQEREAGKRCLQGLPADSVGAGEAGQEGEPGPSGKQEPIDAPLEPPYISKNIFKSPGLS